MVDRRIPQSGSPQALGTSVAAGVGATVVALLLGTMAAFAVQRYRFFGRQTISFLVVLPITFPGIVTGLALLASFTNILGPLGVGLGIGTVIIGHATFCIVIVFNNVQARLRRLGTSLEEASADLGGRSGRRSAMSRSPASAARWWRERCSPSR